VEQPARIAACEEWLARAIAWGLHDCEDLREWGEAARAVVYAKDPWLEFPLNERAAAARERARERARVLRSREERIEALIGFFELIIRRG
jgi:hypothetical protein